MEKVCPLREKISLVVYFNLPDLLSPFFESSFFVFENAKMSQEISSTGKEPKKKKKPTFDFSRFLFLHKTIHTMMYSLSLPGNSDDDRCNVKTTSTHTKSI